MRRCCAAFARHPRLTHADRAQTRAAAASNCAPPRNQEAPAALPGKVAHAVHGPGRACLLSPARKQRLMSCRLVHAGRRDRMSLHILFQLAYGWASPEIGPLVGVTGCTSLVSMTVRLAYWALPERQGPRMARKPKPARSTEASVAVAGLELPTLDKAPVPTRRGRPPKSAEVPLLPATATDSGATALDVADAGAAGVDGAGTGVGDAPSKKRQGRKPKPPTNVVASPLSRGKPRHARGQQGRRPGDAELAAEPENAAPLAEMVHESGLSAGSGDRNAAEGKPAGEAAPPFRCLDHDGGIEVGGAVGPGHGHGAVQLARDRAGRVAGRPQPGDGQADGRCARRGRRLALAALTSHAPRFISADQCDAEGPVPPLTLGQGYSAASVVTASGGRNGRFMVMLHRCVVILRS